MTLSRQYIPETGTLVKLATWEDYTKVTGKPCNWSHFTVREVRQETDCVTLEHYNAGNTGEFFTAHLSQIAKPIGWKSQYTIYVKPDKVETVLSWFSRGIVVRQSHDMSGSMPTAFQPMDNSAQPHWQFCEVTDAVPAEDCRKVFRVVKIETEDIYDVYLIPQTDCKHCNGTGRRTLTELGAIRHESIEEIETTVFFPPRTISRSQLHEESLHVGRSMFQPSIAYKHYATVANDSRESHSIKIETLRP